MTNDPHAVVRLRDQIKSIVEDALNSAIPEPWEVADFATDRIFAALAAADALLAAPVEPVGTPANVHWAHCDMGDYEGSCKYCEDDCPVLAARHPPTDTDRAAYERGVRDAAKVAGANDDGSKEEFAVTAATIREEILRLLDQPAPDTGGSDGPR
jgi:hypothetical protein